MTDNPLTKTFFIIKPEGLVHSKSIKSTIHKNGLRIIDSIKTVLTPDSIKSIYFDTTGDMLEAHVHFMCRDTSEVGIIEGQNAIDKLIEISGSETDPKLCTSGTIRNIFGEQVGYRFGKALYYKNAFHRSSNRAEAKNEVELFERIKNTTLGS